MASTRTTPLLLVYPRLSSSIHLYNMMRRLIAPGLSSSSFLCLTARTRRGLSSSSSAPPPPPPLSSSKRSAFSRWWSNEWITEEAEEIIARAYQQHRSLLDFSKEAPPVLSVEQLEKLGEVGDASFPVKSPQQGLAKFLVNLLVPFTHMFFGERYNHHAWYAHLSLGFACFALN